MSSNSTAEEFFLFQKNDTINVQQKDESYVGRNLNDPNIRHKNHHKSTVQTQL